MSADKNNVTFRALFYLLFTVTHLAVLGITAWTLVKVIHQGEQIARIEGQLNIQPAPVKALAAKGHQL